MARRRAGEYASLASSLRYDPDKTPGTGAIAVTIGWWWWLVGSN